MKSKNVKSKMSHPKMAHEEVAAQKKLKKVAKNKKYSINDKVDETKYRKQELKANKKPARDEKYIKANKKVTKTIY